MSDTTSAQSKPKAPVAVWKTIVPNSLTLLRIAIVPLLVYMFFIPGDGARWTAFALFIIAGLSDFLDGYLARLFKTQSELGALLDPIADKFLVLAALVMLIMVETVYGIAVVISIVILGREILVSGLREFLARDDINLPVTQLAKWKTAFQMVSIGILIAGPAGDKIFPLTTFIGLIGLWVAGVLTVITGYFYLREALISIRSADDGPGPQETQA